MPETRPSIPVLTDAGDAVTLHAGSDANREGGHGRLLAQLEHNAMLALGLVRAGAFALQAVSRLMERATHLLSRHHGVLEAQVAHDLRRVFSDLIQYVQTAQHAGQPLLTGAIAQFALDDAWRQTSEPLQIKLPDLTHSVLSDTGIHGLELDSRMVVLPVLQALNTVRGDIQTGHASLQNATQQLNVVLTRLYESRAKHPPAKAAHDFQQLAVHVRDHVLRAGGAALRVQGPPTERATGLVEGLEESA